MLKHKECHFFNIEVVTKHNKTITIELDGFKNAMERLTIRGILQVPKHVAKQKELEKRSKKAQLPVSSVFDRDLRMVQ